jgi:hypothetical protein
MFVPGPMHVGFVVDKVELGQVVFQFLCFSCVSIIPKVLNNRVIHLVIHLFIHSSLTNPNNLQGRSVEHIPRLRLSNDVFFYGKDIMKIC